MQIKIKYFLPIWWVNSFRISQIFCFQISYDAQQYFFSSDQQSSESLPDSSGISTPPPNQTLTCTQNEHDIVEKEPQSPLTFCKKHPSGKHRVGLNKEWLKQYSWLYFDTEVDVDGNSQDVMLCCLCRKHQSHGSNGSQTWSNVGYKLLCKDKVQSHQDSDQHKYHMSVVYHWYFRKGMFILETLKQVWKKQWKFLPVEKQ